LFDEPQGKLLGMNGGSPAVHGPMESFFHTLKTELVHHRDYLTRDEARRDIFEYIEVFYNRQRRHSTLGYLSPAQFEVTALAA
jgi:putative transposase